MKKIIFYLIIFATLPLFVFSDDIPIAGFARWESDENEYYMSYSLYCFYSENDAITFFYANGFNPPEWGKIDTSWEDLYSRAIEMLNAVSRYFIDKELDRMGGEPTDFCIREVFHAIYASRTLIIAGEIIAEEIYFYDKNGKEK